MTRTIKLAMAAAMALTATSAFATNGDTLIGLGAKTRGMAGVGIGMSHGAESALANPALISSVKDVEISFGGTLFMPHVKYDANVGAGAQNSDADMNMIPEVSIAYKVNDNFYWGIGMWGTAGMGVDYREAGDAATGGNGTLQMVTNLQLMQFGVPFTYARSGFSIGVTPILQYGALGINYKMPDLMNQNNGNPYSIGGGVAQDLKFGFNIGAAYDFAQVGVKGLTLGAVYKSAIEMEYKQQLSSATQPFVDFGIFPAPMGDKLEQPAEIGVGVSYSIAGNTIAFDYKQIKWADATGYKDFGWDNQNVYAIGYEFAMDNWAVRAGFNYAENPIQELPDGTGFVDPNDPNTYAYAGGAALNMFNLLGFPATVEQHYSLGGTYGVTDRVSVDAAVVYAPEKKTEFGTGGLAALGMAGPKATVKHSQTGVSAQVNFAF
ncbi:outer membrane protein transport protein [Sulfurimonas sp. HSL1-6]|uniref:OmpP1/FadL family transporter n=1 Tax=Thiomicrolovo immobilis TaxID=3131935 RepID=UPI0031F97917